VKLPRHAFVRFWDLHAWAGVVIGLLLHFMFFFGAITLFHHQLGVWEEPRLHVAPSPTAPAIDAVIARERAAGTLPAAEFRVYLPHDGQPYRLGYVDAAGAWQSPRVDPGDGTLLAKRSALADFFYGLHYLWIGVPGWEWVYQLAGVLCIFLLVVIVSGVAIHLKDLVRQLHQFRPGQRPRVMWSDLHKVFGVMGLPFQLVYGLSGAILCLYMFLAAPFVKTVFAGDQAALEKAAYGGGENQKVVPRGTPVAPLPLAELVRRGEAAVPGLRAQQVVYRAYGDVAGTVSVGGYARGSFAYGEVELLAATGEPGRAAGGFARPPLARVVDWLYGVHFVRYGGHTALWLHFVLAICACLTVLSGNWIWLARREKRMAHPGNRALQRLTVGFSAGLCLAVAATLLAHRVLPWDVADRANVEKLGFAGAFVAVLIWALAERNPARLWWQQLGAAGVALVVGPLAAGTRLFTAPAAVRGVELALLVTGGVLLVAARFMYRRARTTP
jgi:uncharacterized iron-regulated membrane protein